MILVYGHKYVTYDIIADGRVIDDQWLTCHNKFIIRCTLLVRVVRYTRRRKQTGLCNKGELLNYGLRTGPATQQEWRDSE
jgi:hypothetical protein